MSALHSNAALRCLRREMVRLHDARLELIEAIDDPLIPAGVAIDQILECDREIEEFRQAHVLLEAVLNGRMAA